MTASAVEPTIAYFDSLATDPDAPVALTLKERLQPVEGDGAVIFPPTYADVGYEIATLEDGRKVVAIDSVGSQANRIEPIFKARDADPGYRVARLVPQIDISYGNERKLSLMDAGHRLGDAIVRSTSLKDEAKDAFDTFLRSGNVDALARLAPTSLVFGVWDSRDTQAKLPRLMQSVVRGWDVSKLERSAQYNPALDYAALEVFSEEDKAKAEDKSESPLAQRGFVHVPARGHGGVVVHGEIVRDVTLNLIQLRRLKGADSLTLRRYILGLALVAATEPVEAFMRQGCLLTPHPDHPATWIAVGRDGSRQPLALTRAAALAYAEQAAAAYGVGADRTVGFDKNLAKADAQLAKPAKADAQTAKKGK